MTAHRFSCLPYNSTPEVEAHRHVLVVVCDCGWSDITDNEAAGQGMEAAGLYADHIAEAARFTT